MSKVLTKYTPTRHAIDRARVRFGLASEEVTEWINEKMTDAKFVATNGSKRLIYENEGVQFIIDGATNAVITVHHALSTNFLRPTLEREMRKIKRESIRETRELERRLAKAYAGLAEQMMNYANAKNPSTRASIGERIIETEAFINEVVNAIKRLNDNTQAKLKAIELIAE